MWRFGEDLTRGSRRAAEEDKEDDWHFEFGEARSVEGKWDVTDRHYPTRRSYGGKRKAEGEAFRRDPSPMNSDDEEEFELSKAQHQRAAASRGDATVSDSESNPLVSDGKKELDPPEEIRVKPTTERFDEKPPFAEEGESNVGAESIPVESAPEQNGADNVESRAVERPEGERPDDGIGIIPKALETLGAMQSVMGADAV